MIYQCGASNRSLYMSVEHFLNMTDDDFNQIIAFDQGCFFNHPMTDSALVDNCKDDPDEEEEDVWINEDPADNDLFTEEDIEILMDGAAD